MENSEYRLGGANASYLKEMCKLLEHKSELYRYKLESQICMTINFLTKISDKKEVLVEDDEVNTYIFSTKFNARTNVQIRSLKSHIMPSTDFFVSISTILYSCT